MSDYVIEMLGITKEFPGIKANDNVTLKLKKGCLLYTSGQVFQPRHGFPPRSPLLRASFALAMYKSIS